MLELGGLVAELGQLKKVDPRPRCRSQLAATRRSPDERQWRSGLGLQEVENQMLPTIAEHKSYPRRTIGYVGSDMSVGCSRADGYRVDDMQHILNDPDSQSPDIGPPPVSRFENEDVIAFDPVGVVDAADEMNQDEEPALSINLETRKKRRESGPKLNIRRVSLFESPPEEAETAPKPVRTSAKRKFSVQEDEDKAQQKAEMFRFSRRGTDQAEREMNNSSDRMASPERPVLGSSTSFFFCCIVILLTFAEPVNTDPVISPKKQRSSSQGKPEKNVPHASKPRARPRLNITRTITPPEIPVLPLPEIVPTADIVLDSLPPKTPAIEDIFSPPATEPSTSRPESKDTPPPGDISSADQVGLGGRPGRRARPQVSYKEPSLNTKMRRPDAKLVDAIIDRRISIGSQPAPPTTSKPAIKREGDDLSGWKPISGLSGRVMEQAEVGSPLKEKVDRRETSHDIKVDKEEKVDAEPSCTASKAIAALINETSTAKRKNASALSTSFKDVQPKQEPKDHLSIFDFTDSSPRKASSSEQPSKSARNARRHSSFPAQPAHPEERHVSSQRAEKPDGALPSLHRRVASGPTRTTNSTTTSTSASTLERSASTLNLPSHRTSAARASSSTTGRDRAARPATSDEDGMDSKVDMCINLNKVAKQGGGVGAGTVSETGNLRAERAASRRKSMML